MATLSILILRLRAPRPTIVRLARQPGAVATFSATLMALASALSGFASSALVEWESEDRSFKMLLTLMSSGLGPQMPIHSWSLRMSSAVTASWAVLIVGGRWRPERTWIDRLGLLVGFYWIGIMVLTWFSNLYG